VGATTLRLGVVEVPAANNIVVPVTAAVVRVMAVAGGPTYHLHHRSIMIGTLNWLRFTYDFEIGSA
jgi:hypothetical protein